ncbi:MAG: DNA repair protein RecN [Spirochaetales bacterium]|nr:DNA repair protein RecN [Spirochaetales bacterium]
MITDLSIRNFALIENSELTFSSGLNILSGETGAGKSILIEALSVLLGNRASLEQIRTGMNEASVSATITLDNNQDIYNFLENQNITIENDELILRRHLLSSGKSRSFINGTQVTSKELSFIASILFDFHGQHEGIGLLRKESHILYLDKYLELTDKVNECSLIWKKINNIQNELTQINTIDENIDKRIELLKYEIEEIETTEFIEGEDEELAIKIKRLSNMEKVMTLGAEIQALLGGNGDGAVNATKIAKNQLSQLSELDALFEKDAATLEDIYYKLEDFYSEFSHKISSVQYDQASLDELIERSESIEKIKRKYGGNYNNVMKYLEKAKNELAGIDHQSERKDELNQELQKAINEYKNIAFEISAIRNEKKIILEDKIKNELQGLGMSDAVFEIKIEQEKTENSLFEYKMFSNGIDKVEYLISPNKGEPVKPLTKIASGGELSRIILSLKSILGKDDSVKTMIFDEIDVGIGGKVALYVSNKIKELSKEKQIICITHLPQIAAGGDKNFLIHKESDNTRTISFIKELDKTGKIDEIARMLSGTITDASRLHAMELLNNSEKQ